MSEKSKAIMIFKGQNITELKRNVLSEVFSWKYGHDEDNEIYYEVSSAGIKIMDLDSGRFLNSKPFKFYDQAKSQIDSCDEPSNVASFDTTIADYEQARQDVVAALELLCAERVRRKEEGKKEVVHDV